MGIRTGTRTEARMKTGMGAGTETGMKKRTGTRTNTRAEQGMKRSVCKRVEKKVVLCLAAACLAAVAVTGCGDRRGDGNADIVRKAEIMEETDKVETAEIIPDTVKTAGKAERGAVRPEDDYYSYVNREILAEKQIPADSGGWSYFYELDQKAYEELDGILKEIINHTERYDSGTIEQKIADLYLSAIDLTGRRKAGFGALQPYLDKIRQASDVQEYAEAIGTISRELGYSSLLAPAYYEDMKNSAQYGCYMNGADLGPGKETLEDEAQEELLTIYRKYIKSIMMSVGLNEGEAKEAAAAIFAFQKDLAASTLPLSDQNDPDQTYHPYSLQELSHLYSSVDIPAYLKAAGADGFCSWIVTDPEQAEKINLYLTEENLPLLKNYSIFCLVKDLSPYLTPEIRDAAIAWNNAQKGIREIKSDDRLASELVQSTFGFEFGRLYVEQHFSESDKRAVEAMVHQILDTYRQRINGLDWLSAKTKAKAVNKLSHMTLKVGYPDKWPDYYGTAAIRPAGEGSLIDNMIAIFRSYREYEQKEITEPVDRTQWGMTPQTVNAYYNPLNNEIVFPAAILQPPFYDPAADQASNLGGIGMVIAHEISHAFDSSGARYDENGNYHMWWTEEDMTKFETLTRGVIAYYDGQEVLDGKYVNGSQTLNENIADLGALACVTAVVGDDTEALDLLFKQYARIWASKYTQESMIHRLNTDVHSPASIRVNAVLSSTDAFYRVYPDLKEGDGMYVAPEKRVKIW